MENDLSRVVCALPGLVWTALPDANVDFIDPRIKRAKEMLLQGDRMICEIAMALGFFDQSHFSRTFRRITGVSPREYVRLCEVAEVAV